MSMSQSEIRLLKMQASKAERELAEARAWIKGAPHRHDCPLRSLADVHQGKQHYCTCGRDQALGDI